jgi:hypothetical protein
MPILILNPRCGTRQADAFFLVEGGIGAAGLVVAERGHVRLMAIRRCPGTGL